MRSPWLARFLAIWIGQQFSLAGTLVGRFALIWWLTESTGSATVLAGSTMLAFAPSIVLGPFLGPIIDTGNRRAILLVSDVFTALLSLWLAVLFWSGSMEVWHVYVVILGRAIGSSFHGPTMRSATALLVPQEQLIRVNGLNQTVSAILSIVGPVSGALLLQLLSLHMIMLVDVATALPAVIPLLLLRLPQPVSEQSVEMKKRTYFSNLSEGFLFIRKWPGLIALIGAILVIKIALTPAFSLVPLLILEHFNRAADGLGFFQSVLGAGAAVGGVVLSVWGGFTRRAHTMVSGLVGIGVGVSLIGFVPSVSFTLALLGAFVVGASLAILNASMSAVLQAAVPTHIQGRVFTLVSCAVSLTTPIGLGLAGPISDWLGVRVWFQMGGTACMLVGVLCFFTPAFVRIEEGIQGKSNLDS